MPPRKKPASTASSKPPSRASARTQSKAPVSAGQKRGHSDSEEETDKKPRSKKAKAAASKDEDAEDVKDVEDTKKMVTVVKRGAAPVDPGSPYVDTHQVYASDGEVWDAMLNQTDIGKNANKFYVIQLLHPIGNNSSSILFTRWGRVGETGQKQVKGPFPAVQAIAMFKKQFKDKTSSTWEQRKTMVAKKGKYTWLERSFEEDKESEEKKAGPSKEVKEEEPIPESTLAFEIQELCRLIFSTSLIEAHLSSMNYDANKLPLGKLAKSTILNGFAALKSLSEVISDPNSDTAKQLGGLANACVELTGRYYSIIPHVFGRNRPIVINDMTILKKELELVDALGDMEIAQKLIQTSVMTDTAGKPINPMDAHFRSLQLSTMDPIRPDSKEFQSLVAYATDTHGSTHNYYSINIKHAFRVERAEETQRWIAAGHDKLEGGRRMLLWHGSRSTNFAGILRQGLRIAPPEAPVTGYMFGKGVYFADMVSKSANYCYTNLSHGLGLLLLCEVAAQPFFEQCDANYNAAEECKTAGKMATKGLGRWQPTKWQDAAVALDNAALEGCVMPDGPARDLTPATPTPGMRYPSLLYNEYIVYDPAQIRVRYLLLFKMNNH
ncbi:PARP-domain-containing protein [Dentipellis sp. KUC8613]|nr:PARP-domain-containing protein [Dentipellis sp. KUC8613]